MPNNYCTHTKKNSATREKGHTFRKLFKNIGRGKEQRVNAAGLDSKLVIFENALKKLET